jgi:hypothetical protein
MKLTGHKTEAVYRRYAIVVERDLADAGVKLSTELQRGSDRAAEERPRVLRLEPGPR